MTYEIPDEAECWLRINDPDFGKGEYPYLSLRQELLRRRKETSVNPTTVDQVDFTVLREGNYRSVKCIPILRKDRHQRGQRPTE
jgi:hypothetical protein